MARRKPTVTGSTPVINLSSAQATACYQCEAALWKFTGPAAWHFITLPAKLAAEIEAFHRDLKKDFGTISVSATIGKSKWQTSIFKDKKHRSYLLPVKAEIRRKEKLEAGVRVRLTIEL